MAGVTSILIGILMLMSKFHEAIEYGTVIQYLLFLPIYIYILFFTFYRFLLIRFELYPPPRTVINGKIQAWIFRTFTKL